MFEVEGDGEEVWLSKKFDVGETWSDLGEFWRGSIEWCTDTVICIVGDLCAFFWSGASLAGALHRVEVEGLRTVPECGISGVLCLE